MAADTHPQGGGPERENVLEQRAGSAISGGLGSPGPGPSAGGPIWTPVTPLSSP